LLLAAVPSSVTPELLPAGEPGLETLHALLAEADLPTVGVREGPGRFYLAVDGDETVGGGGVEPYGEAALLRSFVVHPDHRGDGVGGWLVSRLCEVAGATGAETVWLLTETAAPFFADHGFEEVPRESAPEAVRESEEFTTLCGDGATCMARPVDRRVSD